MPPKNVYGVLTSFGLGKEKGLTNQLWQFMYLCTLAKNKFLSLPSLVFRSDDSHVRFDTIWNVSAWNSNKPVYFPTIVNTPANIRINVGVTASFMHKTFRSSSNMSQKNAQVFEDFVKSLKMNDAIDVRIRSWIAQNSPYGCIHARVENDLRASRSHFDASMSMRLLWDLIGTSHLLSDKERDLNVIVATNKVDLNGDDRRIVQDGQSPWGTKILDTNCLRTNMTILNSLIDQTICSAANFLIGSRMSTFSFQVGHMLQNKSRIIYSKQQLKKIDHMSQWKCLSSNGCLKRVT